MVAIAPFKAVHYDAKRVNLGRATSPPYDVQSSEQRDAYLAADSHNIVRVILPPAQDGDQEPPGEPNRYQRAAETLDTWLAEGTLTRDAEPAFYFLEVQHERGTMEGFFARVALDSEYQTVRRHEATLKKPKADRLHLMRATNCNTEPIQALYRDERGWVDEVLRSNALEPVLDFEDEAGGRQRLWRVSRPEAVGEIIAQFQDRHLVIADGHHRYQTALHHWQETGRDEDGGILMLLVRDTHPGITIDPTHRLVSGLDQSVQSLVRAAASWDARTIPIGASDEDAAAAVMAAIEDDRTVAVIHRDTPAEAHVLRLRAEGDVDEGRGRLDELNVTRLHTRLLADAWGVTPENLEGHVTYTRSATEAVAAVRAGACEVAVLLAGLPVNSVLDVAAAGHVMPQKSTYFIPKITSGLVLSPLDEPRPTLDDIVPAL